MLIINVDDDEETIVITDMCSRDILFKWDFTHTYEDVLDNLKMLFDGSGNVYEIVEVEKEPLICNVCMGSGEGRFEGSTCYACGGSGTEPIYE